MTIEEKFNEINVNNLETQLSIISDNTATIVLNGILDTYNSKDFLDKMVGFITEGYYNLVLDLVGINYMSSTGIGVFTRLLKEVKPKGGDVVLVGVIDKVYDVFQLLGFASFFKFADTIDEGLKYTKNRQVEDVFPVSINCPICNQALKARKQGRFRCPSCETILIIDENAKVLLA